MPDLIIIRHGQSVWNLENRFTGDTDIELTSVGIAEAKNAGELIKNFELHAAFTSVLKRAIHTLEIILETTKELNLPLTYNKALNERNYGDLQGLNKAETTAKYGAAQVLLWRRGFNIKPPNGESLQDTYNRVVPYFKKEIEPLLINNKNVLIVAHGNSLRALMMYLENIGDTAIEEVEIATGIPRVYQFEKALVIKNVFNIHT